MTTEHPPTPPPELAQQWVTNAHDIGAPPGTCPNTRKIIVPAINWGWQQRGAVNEAELQKARDEELEACCEWLTHVDRWKTVADRMRSYRRPEPPSLKKQALQALETADGADYPVVATVLTADQHALIRRALEFLPD